MPKVSIVVPIYNVEKYLRECLDSIVNQTLKDIEIICVNDGSTDSCPQILEEFSKKDNRIKVINKANSGYGASMNIGLAAATGEYIGIVESDDFVKTNMFEDLYNLAKENDADVVKSDWFYYWTKNNESRKSGKISKWKSNKITNAYEDKSLLKIMPSIWSAIYKREFLSDKGINFLETPGASYQDTSFYLKVLMSAKRIVLTSNAYVYYRQDNINSSCNSKEKAFAIYDEFDEVELFMQANPELAEEFAEYIYTLQYRSYFMTMVRIEDKFIDDFLDRFSAKFKDLYERKQLGKLFYLRNSKRDLLTLITDKEKFKKVYQRELRKINRAEKRRKLISININSSRVSIVLFGKQIVRIG